MNSDLLHGELVHLTVENPEVKAEKFSRWYQDSEWIRLLDTEPPRLFSANKWKELFEKDMEKDTHDLFFTIRTLDTDLLIGFVGLFDLFMQHGDALVAIALGERENWGKGFGTDAMRVILRYAFNELNLRRAGLIVFDYNPRAIRSYEKAGFRHEGTIRKVIQRDGKRYDFHYMGILREEWLANNHTTH